MLAAEMRSRRVIVVNTYKEGGSVRRYIFILLMIAIGFALAVNRYCNGDSRLVQAGQEGYGVHQKTSPPPRISDTQVRKFVIGMPEQALPVNSTPLRKNQNKDSASEEEKIGKIRKWKDYCTLIAQNGMELNGTTLSTVVDDIHLFAIVKDVSDDEYGDEDEDCVEEVEDEDCVEEVEEEGSGNGEVKEDNNGFMAESSEEGGEFYELNGANPENFRLGNDGCGESEQDIEEAYKQGTDELFDKVGTMLSHALLDSSSAVREAAFDAAFSLPANQRDVLLNLTLDCKDSKLKDKVLDFAIASDDESSVIILMKALDDSSKGISKRASNHLAELFSESFESTEEARDWWEKNRGRLLISPED